MHTDKISPLKKTIATAKKSAKNKEKGYGGARIKKIFWTIEGILKVCNVDQGVHHSGELVGGAACQLPGAKALRCCGSHCSEAQEPRCSGAQAPRCSDAQVPGNPGAQVLRYLGAQVLR